MSLRNLPRYLLCASLALATTVLAQQAPQYAGPTKNGFLLPNGWVLAPAGAQVTLTDLPLNILPLSDGRHALVATAATTPIAFL